MSLIVQKFGGSSLSNLKMIKKVSLKVIDVYNKKNDIVVILSAMNKITNRLIKLSSKISLKPNEREMDLLISTGEQISISLLSMILNKMGYKSKSFLAHQIKIITNSKYLNASILKINTQKIKTALIKKNIVIIAGFQGIDTNKNITTLGRGGSDTTALALAAALKANLCEIYTDVDGIYTADPNICSNAKKIEKISYDNILHMADSGSKVLHKQSIVIAKKNKLKIYVKSSFSKENGSTVLNYNSKKKDSIGISYNMGYCKILSKKIRLDYINKIFEKLKSNRYKTELLFTKKSNENQINCIFIFHDSSFLEFINDCKKKIYKSKVTINKKMAKISIVRCKKLNKHCYSSNITDLLIKNKVQIYITSISKKKISYLVKEESLNLTINKIHKFINLI